MFNIGPMELLVIVALALIVLGPDKFPEAGRAVGRAMREFRSATDGLTRDFTRDVTNHVSSTRDEANARPAAPQDTVHVLPPSTAPLDEIGYRDPHHTADEPSVHLSVADESERSESERPEPSSPAQG